MLNLTGSVFMSVSIATAEGFVVPDSSVGGGASPDPVAALVSPPSVLGSGSRNLFAPVGLASEWMADDLCLSLIRMLAAANLAYPASTVAAPTGSSAPMSFSILDRHASEWFL